MSDLAEVIRRVERLEAVHEIENLMGRYEFYHSAYRDEMIPPMFADRDDLMVEMPFGTFLGRDAALRVWAGVSAEDAPPRDLTGEYVEHLLTTPVIEVARDGLTAKAAWISPGAEAHHFGWEDGNPLRGFWYWGRYAADFIRQNGVWKIWHMTLSTTFTTDYNSSYTDVEAKLSEPPIPSGPHGPDAPPRRQVTYSPTWDPRALELAPEPYDTFPGA
ncbi:nuclear transport factor 2 family protein [Nonomuraea turkmeniaca]|uniref:Nuclear transport factor 2 family protein n=1 Tax=Nonomuraea turkmeniaca TaxID=103838 RepID=A0A5S4FWA4_9ACTN|nr:nuclear transport factor 2 family protein [Nonomuraea turkmeniaca]TMR24943.1 nuclear transport factor 2 family protein [Nonomuraea turkmeniaca]